MSNVWSYRDIKAQEYKIFSTIPGMNELLQASPSEKAEVEAKYPDAVFAVVIASSLFNHNRELSEITQKAYFSILNSPLSVLLTFFRTLILPQAFENGLAETTTFGFHHIFHGACTIPKEIAPLCDTAITAPQFFLFLSMHKIDLTDTIGMSMGIVSTLIALSKIFDGITDFFFGSLIDKTHTKMGKARPWMLWPYIGCSITLVACFSIPTSWGQTAQYIFFFLSYTLLNAVFFTANNIAYVIAALGRVGVMLGGYMGSLPLMLAFTAVSTLGIAPLQGDMNALIACCSEYTTMKTGYRLEGMMYSCSSLGIKLGGALGTAICGWLLAAAGYVENAAVQTAATVNMLNFMYLWMPIFLNTAVAFLLVFLRVEKANKDLIAARK